MLNKAVEAFNNIAQCEIKGIEYNLETIRAYLLDQSTRYNNRLNGLDYLNREMDVIMELQAKINNANLVESRNEYSSKV